MRGAEASPSPFDLSGQTLLQSHPRSVLQQAACQGHIGEGVTHIALLGQNMAPANVLPDETSHDRQGAVDRDPRPAPDIERSPLRFRPQGQEVRLYPIRNVGEITRLLAVPVNHHFLSRKDGVNESFKRHIRTLSRTVDREIPQGDDWKAVVQAIEKAEVFPGELCDPIGRERSRYS